MNCLFGELFPKWHTQFPNIVLRSLAFFFVSEKTVLKISRLKIGESFWNAI